MMDKTTATTPGTSATDRDQAALALKSDLVHGAHDVAQEVRHIATDVAGQAKHAAEQTISSGQKRAAEGLGHVARAIRKTGEQLRAEDQGAMTEYLDRAARQVDSASEYLERRSLGQLLGDVEQFARREPALFLGGAFIAGLLGGRFLKSSKPQATQQLGAQGTAGSARHANYDGGRSEQRGSARSPSTVSTYSGADSYTMPIPSSGNSGPRVDTASRTSTTSRNDTASKGDTASKSDAASKSASSSEPNARGESPKKTPGAM